MAVYAGTQAIFREGEPNFIEYTPSGAAVAAGQVVVVGDVPMIAHIGIADGVLGALAVWGGVYDFVADAAIAAGKSVFWDDTNKKVTATTTNKGVGFSMTAAAADLGVIRVQHSPIMKTIPT